MAVTYKWTFSNIGFDSKSKFPQTIRSITYKITGTDGINITERSGTVLLDPPKEDFIPYDEITNTLIIQWIIDRFPELAESHLTGIVNELTELSLKPKVDLIPKFAEGKNFKIRNVTIPKNKSS